MKRMIVMLTCICALAVSIGRVNAQDAEPEAEKPITIEFVCKDPHVVMHYVGLKYELNITLEDGALSDLGVLSLPKSAAEFWAYMRVKYEVDVIENGRFVYIKKRRGPDVQDYFRMQRRQSIYIPCLPVMPRPADSLADL